MNSNAPNADWLGSPGTGRLRRKPVVTRIAASCMDGYTLRPAWVIFKGLATISLHVTAQSVAALQLAQWLESQPNVARVFCPGLPSHPQHELARRRQRAGGGTVSFEVRGGRAAAWRAVNNCRLLSITANLGDTKTTITHPASTTHGRISSEARVACGISEGLLRVAVGLENVTDTRRTWRAA